MKTNSELHHGGYLKGEPGTKYYKLYAEYLAKFIEAYQKQNVTMWGLTVVNEPTVGESSYMWNVLQLNSTQQRDFIKLDLGPQLVKLTTKPKLMIFDDSVPPMEEYVTTVLSDPDAAKYVDGIAYHWYMNLFASPTAALDKVATKYPDKFLLSTEACSIFGSDGQHVMLGSWLLLESYAKDIIQDLNHHTTGWIDWNMALDLEGGPTWAKNYVDSPIIVNASSGEYYKQPSYYAMGHFSKFLPPESVRLEHEIEYQDKDKDQDDILATVFQRPDGGRVATVLNKKQETIRVQLHQPDADPVEIQMEPNSLESFVWFY